MVYSQQTHILSTGILIDNPVIKHCYCQQQAITFAANLKGLRKDTSWAYSACNFLDLQSPLFLFSLAVTENLLVNLVSMADLFYFCVSLGGTTIFLHR